MNKDWQNIIDQLVLELGETGNYYTMDEYGREMNEEQKEQMRQIVVNWLNKNFGKRLP